MFGQDYAIFWTAIAAVGSVVGAVSALIVVLRKKDRVEGELKVAQDERDYVQARYDALSKRLNGEKTKLEDRLALIDPERFIDQLDDAYGQGEFSKAEDLALRFTNAQSEAFGRAAEVLTEQRLIDSEEYGQPVVEDALRFVELGLAAQPGSARLTELKSLAQDRAEAITRGEPIATLGWNDLTDFELNQLSQQLIRSGDYALAEIAARRSVPLAALRTGRNSSNFAGAIAQHAAALVRVGAYQEAEPIYLEALEIDRKTIGPEHPEYATRLNNFAALLQATGRYEEAEPLFLEALEIDRKTIGPEHPDYASHLNNLALLLHSTGRYEEAEPLFREALEIDRKTKRTEHPDYATRLNNLALLLHSTGRYEEAEPRFLEALEIDRKTIGPEHPDYAIHLGNLALLLHSTGRYEEAEPLYRKVLKIFETALGPDHPHTHNARKNLDTFLAEKPD